MSVTATSQSDFPQTAQVGGGGADACGCDTRDIRDTGADFWKFVAGVAGVATGAD
ncbi:hypothetical protein [Thalassovita litoralis]|uniref:hypothetical protein n=1 Tax=Thalassovita litoralis TaxID=1010611 RepID=UPI00163DCF1A|nr:hypothetical protein [Thalassovita litoralis]